VVNQVEVFGDSPYDYRSSSFYYHTSESVMRYENYGKCKPNTFIYAARMKIEYACGNGKRLCV
jgi:hypothetical protein